MNVGAMTSSLGPVGWAVACLGGTLWLDLPPASPSLLVLLHREFSKVGQAHMVNTTKGQESMHKSSPFPNSEK